MLAPRLSSPQKRRKGHRARTHRRTAACRTQHRLEADGRRGPAGPAVQAEAPVQDWLCALLPNRPEYLLQLQTLLFEDKEDTNELEDGDTGIGRSVRRRATTVRGWKLRRGLRSYMGCE
eukprot:4737487-Pleurochrysis_carterae.AAC.5